MSARRWFLVASVALAVACGISAVGELATGDGPNDGGSDGSGPNVTDAGGIGDGAPANDASDAATFDAQGRCLEVCEAGTCDAGTCGIDCADAGSCNQRVVCPPDVACDVRCGASQCTQGIDCRAARACNIDCADNACVGQNIVCGGGSCSVTCADNACSQGIQCDAGSCDLRCAGAGSCANQAVACNATGACNVACEGLGSCPQSVKCDAGSCNIRCAGSDTCNSQRVDCNAISSCTVQCGADAGGSSGASSCRQGVACAAGTACNILCNSDNTCQGQAVVARAANVDVKCLDDEACNAGIRLSGGDAGLTCRKTGSCEGTAYCDAGSCHAQCISPDDPQTSFCCPAGTTCTLDASQCSASDFKIGCP